jgi:hypothetical protein
MGFNAIDFIPGFVPVPTLLAAGLALFVFIQIVSRSSDAGEGGTTPPSLHDPIPYLFNTVQFVFNNEKFMKRATYVGFLSGRQCCMYSAVRYLTTLFCL